MVFSKWSIIAKENKLTISFGSDQFFELGQVLKILKEVHVSPKRFRSDASQFPFIHAVCHANSVDFKITAVTQYQGI